MAGATGTLTRGARTACERGGPRASAEGTRLAAGPGRWRGTSEADESGARPPGGEEVCGPCSGLPHLGEAESGSLSPLWAEALSAGGFMVEAAGGQEAAFLRENKGPARRGRLPLRPDSSLGAGRKPGQSGLRGGTRCSFVRAEWGGGACCHVVALVFRPLSTRAVWEGVKGWAEEKTVQQRVARPCPACHCPGRHSSTADISLTAPPLLIAFMLNFKGPRIWPRSRQ